MKIALLGAESTGKTRLAHELAARLQLKQHRVEVVDEVLREWCVREGRAPRPEEQMPIACEQERRVDEACARSEIVIADSTALMVAVYGGMLFNDGELFRFALEHQRGYDKTLVTGLDLPWVADGLQREGPQVRGPTDAILRDVLEKDGIPYAAIYGQGDERATNALAALGFADNEDSRHTAGDSRRWQWVCEKCSDPVCEHRLFSRLHGRAPEGGAPR